MEKISLEVWMRGPVAGIPPLLQPVAHALLQAREEIPVHLSGFPENELWEKPAGVASVGFHLRHLSGVLDRLFTYARGEMLSDQQLLYLANEDTSDPAVTPASLIIHFNRQVDQAIAQLAATDESQLTAARSIGRKQLPTTLLGLLFHAAEHTQRHVGQLLVTAKLAPSFGK